MPKTTKLNKKNIRQNPRVYVSKATKSYIAKMAKFGASETQFIDQVFTYFRKNISTTKIKKMLNYGTETRNRLS